MLFSGVWKAMVPLRQKQFRIQVQALSYVNSFCCLVEITKYCTLKSSGFTSEPPWAVYVNARITNPDPPHPILIPSLQVSNLVRNLLHYFWFLISVCSDYRQKMLDLAKAMVLNFQLVPEALARLLKCKYLVFDASGLGQGPSICIYNQFPSDTPVSSPGTTLWETLDECPVTLLWELL